MHYLYEKYYKPITVQYYVADSLSWVPRLNLLELWVNWTYEYAIEWDLFICRGITIIETTQSKEQI